MEQDDKSNFKLRNVFFNNKDRDMLTYYKYICRVFFSIQQFTASFVYFCFHNVSSLLYTPGEVV